MRKNAALICFLVGGLLAALSPSVEARGWNCAGGTWRPSSYSGVSSTPPVTDDRQKQPTRQHTGSPASNAKESIVVSDDHISILGKAGNLGYSVFRGNTQISNRTEAVLKVDIMTRAVYDAISKFVSSSPTGAEYSVTTETGEKLVFKRTS